LPLSKLTSGNLIAQALKFILDRYFFYYLHFNDDSVYIGKLRSAEKSLNEVHLIYPDNGKP